MDSVKPLNVFMLKLRVNSTGAVYNAQNMFHNFILLRIYIIYILVILLMLRVRKEKNWNISIIPCYVILGRVLNSQ